MMRLLPESLERRDQIERMPIGAERWTVPWAMWVDQQRRCWLHPKYETSEAPGGTVTMRIVRTPEGYIVDVARCRDHGWEPSAEPGYVGGIGVSGFLPVCELIGSY